MNVAVLGNLRRGSTAAESRWTVEIIEALLGVELRLSCAEHADECEDRVGNLHFILT